MGGRSDVITRRGVDVPRLIDSGRFLAEGKAAPIRMDEHNQFHAWQKITKAEGPPVPAAAYKLAL
jgi:hypothetical protein